MTDRECFKLAGEMTLAMYAGTVIGNLINLWRGRSRKRRIPLERIDKLDPTQWRPGYVLDCTCTWNKMPTPDSSASMYAYKRATDPNCPFHGDRSER